MTLEIAWDDTRWTKTKRSPYIRYLELSDENFITTEPLEFGRQYDLNQLFGEVFSSYTWYWPPSVTATKHRNDPYGNYDLIVEVQGARSVSKAEHDAILADRNRGVEEARRKKEAKLAKQRKEFERLKKVFPDG